MIMFERSNYRLDGLHEHGETGAAAADTIIDTADMTDTVTGNNQHCQP